MSTLAEILFRSMGGCLPAIFAAVRVRKPSYTTADGQRTFPCIFHFDLHVVSIQRGRGDVY